MRSALIPNPSPLTISSRSGQSLAELLISIAVGIVLIGAAVGVILPSLKSDTQVIDVQTGSVLAQGLLNNVQVFSEGSWDGLLALATGSGNPYYLNTSSSPFVAVGAGGGTSSTFNGYAYERTVTINDAEVSGTLALFPMLFSSNTSGFLAASSSGGTLQNANGYDFIFSPNSGCTAPLPFERESYASSTGNVVAWVQVPSISGATDAVIYLCYDNAAVTTDQSNAAGTWNANYTGVWHFANVTTTLYALDSVTGISGTLTGPPAVGTTSIIGGSAAFGGHANDSIATDISAASAAYTVSVWENFAVPASLGRLFDKTNSSLQGIEAYVNGSDFTFQANWSGTQGEWSYKLPSANAWHFISVSYSDASTANVPTFFIDGAATTSVTTQNPAGTYSDPGDLFYIGNRSAHDRGWSGTLDEFEVSNKILAPSWILTEYNNQYAPTLFSAVGAQTTNSAVGSTGIQSVAVGSSSYSRYFYLSDVYRSASGSIVATGGGTYDPSTKQVTVVYSWPGGPSESVSTYLTRNDDSVIDQTDWSGGSGQNGPMTTTNSQFATSSNIDYSTTTGSIYLPIPGY